jgi:hypothetical protein
MNAGTCLSKCILVKVYDYKSIQQPVIALLLFLFLDMQEDNDFEEDILQNLKRLSGCELHLHILGAYYAEDVLEPGKEVYQQGAWDEYRYEDTYQALFGIRPVPMAIFEEALSKGDEGLELIKRWHVY